MNGDKTVVAVFSKVIYTLESRLSPGGGGSVDPPDDNYEAGANVTLTAIPATGYRFDHWGGDASGVATTLNVVVDANKTVTAYFTRLYTLSTSSNPTDGGSISPTRGTYDAGTVVNLTATAALGYIFKNWSGTDSNSVNPTAVTMNSDKSVTVYFTKLTAHPQEPIDGELYGQIESIQIQLNAGQWVQGEIIANTYDIGVQIQDPNGNVVKELGRIRQATFSLQAQTSGTYNFVIYENYGIGHNFYTLTYTIYS
jgi:heme/copper-type cytochrome/quinol oxidase subunit 2